jgi:hypothetical protein
MRTLDFKSKSYTFTVDGQRGIPQEKAEMIYKKMYENSKEDFRALMDSQGQTMSQFADYMDSIWDSILDFTVQDAFKEPNLEIRRLYFKAIGIEKIFAELNPKRVDKQALKLRNRQWDVEGNELIVDIDDTYELYKIDGDKLFPEEKSSWRTANATIYAVRCWCTTTGREYWIYVPRHVGEKNDAIEAIAWTARLCIENPEYIYRQGDIFIAKASEKSVQCNPYNLDKNEYLKLLKAQS